MRDAEPLTDADARARAEASGAGGADEPTAAHEQLDADLAAIFDDDDDRAADVGGIPVAEAPARSMAPEEAPSEESLGMASASVYPDELPGQLAGDVLVLDDHGPTPAPRPKRMSRLERRRRVKLQARRVRRIVRHIEPWSVFKVSLIFFACLWVVLLIAGVMVWGVAESSGTVTKTEDLIREYFVLESFELDGREIFRGYALGGLLLAIAGTSFNVLMCLLFNLISDLVGGIRITMIEEETARPAPSRKRKRRRRR